MYSDISDLVGHDLEGIEAGVKKGKMVQRRKCANTCKDGVFRDSTA